MPSETPVSLNRLAVPARKAAELLSISERSLWSITAPRGDLPCLRIGRRCLYLVDSLRVYVEAREHRGAGP